MTLFGRWLRGWHHVVSWRDADIYCVRVVCGAGSCGSLIDYPRSGLWKPPPPPNSPPPTSPTSGPMAHTSWRYAGHKPNVPLPQHPPRFCAVNSTTCWIYTRERVREVRPCRGAEGPALSHHTHCWKHGRQIFIIIIFYLKNNILLSQLWNCLFCAVHSCVRALHLKISHTVCIKVTAQWSCLLDTAPPTHSMALQPKSDLDLLLWGFLTHSLPKSTMVDLLNYV
jgi:hypothetical protein